MILDIDEDGNSNDQTVLPGLSFYEQGASMSLAKTHDGGYVFITTPKNGGYTWLYKWGNSIETINKKISDAGYGGDAAERTGDNGFIFSTGNILLKTDPYLAY